MTKNSTKEAILAISFRVFLEKGYKNATLTELVKASKVSKGAFYHYFKSKEELFDAAIDKYFFALASPVIDFEPSENQTFLENIQNYLTQKQQVVRKVAEELSLTLNANYLNVLLEAMQLFEHHKKRSLALLDKELIIYQKIIQIAQSKNEVKPNLDAVLLSKQFYFMLDGFELHTLILSDLNAKSYAEVNQLFEQFYQLIKV
ncbi:TetR/AcrR family transcriptional regulator [Bernardetia sp. MNP-M8]|uniref:TetR/AcrR family transcriptional regulator n=1 Tax=Bernardetia sp. MNP-M8 TaxID=3127470 RepID=UPI0030CC708A